MRKACNCIRKIEANAHRLSIEQMAHRGLLCDQCIEEVREIMLELED